MSPAQPSQPIAPQGTCFSFTTDLYIGSRGQDVANLQTFLTSRGYSIPSIASGVASPGYYGAQTYQALAQFQSTYGLSPSGSFDDATRARANSICGTSGTSSGGYVGGSSGSTNGTNALGSLAIVSPNGGETWQTGSYQTIRWTSPSYSVPTYVDVKLLRYQPCTTSICPMIAFAPYTIATGVPANQNSYNWTAGKAYQAGSTASGTYTTAPDGHYTIQICQTGTSVCVSSANSFGLFASGNPTTGQNILAPVVSGIDAPTTLAVGQAAVWTIHASDPRNGTMTYSVDWGDQPVNQYQQTTTATAGMFTQTTSFTHSYSSPGIYVAVFTVRNSYGLTAQASVTTNVGGIGADQNIKVLSPNGGETWKRGTQQQITWQGQLTYNGAQNGYVRITLDHQCPSGMYCTMMYYPTYILQTSAPNSGSSLWTVGSATIDGSTAVSVPSGTYVVTVCRYQSSSISNQCDASDYPFTVTD